MTITARISLASRLTGLRHRRTASVGLQVLIFSRLRRRLRYIWAGTFALIILPVVEVCAYSALTPIAAQRESIRLPPILQSNFIPQSRRQPRNSVEVAEVAAVPTITSLSPPSGPIGTWVTIEGSNFTSDNLVQFRSAQSSFAAGSPVGSDTGTRLRFQVTPCPSRELQCPAYYVSPGAYKVTVMNVNGESNEAMFTLTRN